MHNYVCKEISTCAKVLRIARGVLICYCSVTAYLFSPEIFISQLTWEKQIQLKYRIRLCIAIRITRFNVNFFDILRKSRIIEIKIHENLIFLRLPNNPRLLFSTVPVISIYVNLYFKIKHLIFVIKLWIFFCFSHI